MPCRAPRRESSRASPSGRSRRSLDAGAGARVRLSARLLRGPSRASSRTRYRTTSGRARSSRSASAARAARGVVVETGVDAPAGVEPAPIEVGPRRAAACARRPRALARRLLRLDAGSRARARRAEAARAAGERRATGAGMAGEAEPAELTAPQQAAVARIVEALDGRRRSPAARRRDRERQDRGLPPGVRRRARARPRRDRARARDRARRRRRSAASGALRRPRRGAPLGPDRGRAAGRARADRARRGAGRRRRALGGLRAGAATSA